MGTRYTVEVWCECGREDEAWYAPTSGFLDWTCPVCKRVLDLETLTGIDAESTATTIHGVNAIRAARTPVPPDAGGEA